MWGIATGDERDMRSLADLIWFARRRMREHYPWDTGQTHIQIVPDDLGQIADHAFLYLLLRSVLFHE
jgi:ATP-dependent protease ClpP protease subunit